MPEDKPLEKEIERSPELRKLTRKEIREALACPICKKAGALLDDVCRYCGSYQDDDGNWIVPEPKKKTEVPKSQEPERKKPWYEEEL